VGNCVLPQRCSQ